MSWAFWDPEGNDLPAFIEETSSHGTWGGMVQIQAFALQHHLNIAVYQEESLLAQAGEEGCPQRHLLFCNAAGAKGNCDHYDVLVHTTRPMHDQPPGADAVPSRAHEDLQDTFFSQPSLWTPDKLSCFDQVKVLTINVTGSKEALAWALEQQFQVILVQEHKADRTKVQSWQTLAARMGWHGVWQPATRTPKGGASGGVATLAPQGIPIFRGPSEYSHRWIRASVPWARTKELQLFSVYACDKGHQDEHKENRLLFEQLRAELHALGRVPYVLGGDWNQAPL